MKKRVIKSVLAGMLALSTAAALPLSASAAWVRQGNDWQWTENGTAVTGWRWIAQDSAWYHFDDAGNMTTGWMQDDGEWYYLQPSGVMARFWNQIGGKWYFMNTSGAIQYGWIMARGKWYFLGPDGAMITGVAQIDGKTYYFDETGAMQTGTVKLGGKTYTFRDSGEAAGTAPAAEKAYKTTSRAPIEVAVTAPSRPVSGGGGGGIVTPDPEPLPDFMTNSVNGWYQINGRYYLDTEVQIDFDVVNVNDIKSIKFELYHGEELMGDALSEEENLKTLLDDCKQYWPNPVEDKQWLSCAFAHREDEDNNGYWARSAYAGYANDEIQPDKLIVTIVTQDGISYQSESAVSVEPVGASEDALAASLTSWYEYNGNWYLDTGVLIDFDVIAAGSIDTVYFELFNDGELAATACSSGLNWERLLDDCRQYWPDPVTGKLPLSCAFAHREVSDNNGYWVRSAYAGRATDEDQPDQLKVTILTKDQRCYTAETTAEVEPGTIDSENLLTGSVTSWYQYGDNWYLDTSVQINFDLIAVDDIKSLKFELCNDGVLMGTAFSDGTNLETLLNDCKQYWPDPVAGKQPLSCAFAHRDDEENNGYWVRSAYEGGHDTDTQPTSLKVTLVTADDTVYCCETACTVSPVANTEV